MKRLSFCVSFFSLCGLLIGCAHNPVNDVSEDEGNLPFAVAKSVSVNRDNSPVPQELLNEQALSNNRFAVSMYKLLVEENKNLFFSPYSITAALAMTAAGAPESSSTYKQMRNAMQVTLKGDDFDRALNGIDRSLMEYAAGTDGITINIVNSTWLQTGWNFKVSYLDHLSRFYGAGVNLLDFMSKPEESRVIINTWVADQTNQKIKDLLPQGVITPATVLVLTNAIYFLADWMFSFKPELTEDRDFRLLDNNVIKTPLMLLADVNKKARMLYARGSGVRAMDFPYKGNRFVMTVLLPDTGNFLDFEKSLSIEAINSLIAKLDTTELYVALPKFRFTSSSISLVKALKSLGMKDAFSPGIADFSGIDGSKSLFISEVLHKAFISVDEKGTEAAAATAVIVSRTSINPEENVFVVDRPFIFVIRDRVTGTILFMGRILNPAVAE